MSFQIIALTKVFTARLHHFAVDLVDDIVDIFQVVTVRDDLITTNKILYHSGQCQLVEKQYRIKAPRNNSTFTGGAFMSAQSHLVDDHSDGCMCPSTGETSKRLC